MVSYWPLGYFAAVAGVFAALALPTTLSASPAPDDSDELRTRFEYLGRNGNSNCSRRFMESVSSMPEEARLRGSCCGPMNLHRYGDQVAGLEAFADIDSVPADPYDISAPLAVRLVRFYETSLTSEQQAACDYALQNPNRRGPGRCRCWRRAVHGGLAKHLTRDRGFTGDQIAALWNFSDGCGGTSHAH